MERKVGEIFEYNEEWYQCIVQPKGTEGQSCSICSMNFGGKCPIHVIECAMEGRSDGKSVIFKKLEKVGEPIRIENKSYQKIKAPCALCDHCAFYDNFSRNCKLSYYINHYPAYSCLTNEMFVEIKQNKENMEEKKLNLKEFNLEAAKAGKPVCTRDGRKARIICFDAKCNKPIVALIYDCNKETVFQYLENGRFFVDQIDKYDLMMLPQKKEGWINIYGEEKGRYCSNVIYSSKEEALNISKQSLNISKQSEEHITTIKIEWEE